MTDQALRPTFFSNLPTFVKEKELDKQELTDEEEHLSSLSNHTGWRILKEYSESLIDDLDQVTDLSLAQGLDLAEIGKNAVVANLAKGIIKRILMKVQDAKEAIEANGRPKE